jgi:hypothetical protein
MSPVSTAPAPAPSFDATKMAASLIAVGDGLKHTASLLLGLAADLVSRTSQEADVLAPDDPANKVEIGGLMKLTPRGIEACYRLFDAGKSRYAVCQLMKISFGAATHRHEAWKKLGGVTRTRQTF